MAGPRILHPFALGVAASVLLLPRGASAQADGQAWSEFASVRAKTCNASYVPNQHFETPGPVQAKFLQLYVTQSGLDAATAEEYEIEVYGTATSSQCGLTNCGVGTPMQRERGASVGILALLGAFGLRRRGSRRRAAS
jgi:hypothetical protein